MPKRHTLTKQEIDKTWNRHLLRCCFYGYVKPCINFIKRRPRKFHCFVIGPAKTGTHSLHGLFSECFISRHEPSFYYLNKLIIDAENNQLSRSMIQKFYKYRDRAMQLDIESNYLNYYFIEDIVSLFPAAKFIILYREPRSWLDSWINHVIERREIKGGIADEGLYAIYRSSNYSYDEQEESILKMYELYPLRCYLDHWLDCYKRLIESIPDKRILVLPTNRISSSQHLIARFLDINDKELAVEKSHLFTAKCKHNILDKLNSDYVNSLLSEYENHSAILTINRKLSEQG